METGSYWRKPAKTGNGCYDKKIFVCLSRMIIQQLALLVFLFFLRMRVLGNKIHNTAEAAVHVKILKLREPADKRDACGFAIVLDYGNCLLYTSDAADE